MDSMGFYKSCIYHGIHHHLGHFRFNNYNNQPTSGSKESQHFLNWKCDVQPVNVLFHVLFLKAYRIHGTIVYLH